MNDNLINLVVGIVSGVAASVILFYSARMISWLRKRINAEADLPNKWNWFDETNSDPVGKVELVQHGSNVSGKLVRLISTTKENTERVFKFGGTFYGDQMVLTYSEPKNPKVMVGAMVLRLSPDRQTLFGNTMYVEHHENKISTYRFVLSTKNTMVKGVLEFLKGRSEKIEVEKPE